MFNMDKDDIFPTPNFNILVTLLTSLNILSTVNCQSDLLQTMPHVCNNENHYVNFGVAERE